MERGWDKYTKQHWNVFRWWNIIIILRNGARMFSRLIKLLTLLKSGLKWLVRNSLYQHFNVVKMLPLPEVMEKEKDSVRRDKGQETERGDSSHSISAVATPKKKRDSNEQLLVSPSSRSTQEPTRLQYADGKPSLFTRKHSCFPHVTHYCTNKACLWRVTPRPAR